MADDNTLNIRVTADVSALQSGMATAASATEDFASRTQAAMQAYNEVASGSVTVQKMLAGAFDQAVVSGKNTVEAMEAAVASVRGYTDAATDAAEKSDILAAAERQFAAATLEAVAARKILNSTVATNIGKSDQGSLDQVAAAQARDFEAVEQLALAKSNLAEVQEFVATTAAQEADAQTTSAETTAAAAEGVNALGEAYAKLEAEIASVEGTVLASLEVSAGDQVGEVSALTAAYGQLAEATLEAASAKQALNDAISTYSGRSDEEAIRSVAAAQRQADEATEQLVLAKRNLAEVEEYSANAANMESAALNGNTEALVETTAATEALSGAQETSVSASMAAQGALRTMEGSMFGASRAAGELLTKTLGLGPVLEAAFPIIGAVALISILYQVGDALYQAYEKANQARDAINRAFADSSDRIEETTAQIELENSKLQDQIDKLEGHPNNGLQTALHQDIVEADKLQDALDGVLKRILAIDQNKTLQVSFTESLISNAPSSTGVAKQTANIVNSAQIESQRIHTGYQQELTAAGTDQTKIVAATKKYHDDIAKAISDANAQLQPLLDQNVAMQKKAQNQSLEIQKVVKTALMAGGEGSESATKGANTAAGILTQTDYGPRINDIKTAMGLLNDLQAQMQAMEAQSPLEQKLKQLQSNKSGESAANKAAEQHLRDIETQFSSANTPDESGQFRDQNGQPTLIKMKPGEAAEFWQQFLGDFKAGSAEYKQVLDQIERYTAENSKQVSEARTKGSEVLKSQADADENELLRMQNIYAALVKKYAQMDAAAEKANAKALAGTAAVQHQGNLEGIQGQEGKVQQEQTLGLIDPTKALQQLKQLHEQEIAEDERFIEQEITIYAKEPEKVQALEKKLAEIHRQGLEQQLRDTTKILKQEQEEWKKIYSTITQDVNHAITEIITTTQSPAQAFAKMFDQLLGQLATFVLKWIEKKTEMWIEDEAITANAQVQGLALSKSMSLSQIVSAAHVAAANTYASVSSIPVIGPVIAPPAAAVAFAAVMAFDAFEAGGVVAGSHGMPVPIMAHAGERVLSAPQTQNFERMVNQPSSRGNTFNLNYNGQVNAYDRNGMRSTLKSHANDILDIVKQGWNSGALR